MLMIIFTLRAELRGQFMNSNDDEKEEKGKRQFSYTYHNWHSSNYVHF